MVFGDHDPASTRHHYFGNAPSYIVFECLTRTGPQCLVVFGSGDIAGSKFSRLVYRGRFDRCHYEDGEGRLADVAKLRQHLLTFDVLEVRHSRLWRVLGRPSEMKGDDEEGGRFGILPLKRVEDYHSFREVFIRLLSLSRATADDLKRLLIACCCQSIRATSVDVKRQYEDQFSRLERGDLELEWLKAVSPLIDQGITLRTGVSELDGRVTKAAVEARQELRRCAVLDRGLQFTTQAQRDQIKKRMEELRQREGVLRESLGNLKAKRDSLAKQLEELDAAHRRWEAVSELELTTWKSRESELQRLVQETRAKLSESERYDVPALQREWERKRRELEQRTRELNEWEARTAGFLDTLGFRPNQIGTLFMLINPDLARASYLDVFGASQPNSIKTLVKNTLATHANGSFAVDGVTINTAGVHVPEDLASQSRDVATERVQFIDQEVIRAKAVLEVARDVKAAQDQLQKDIDELKAVSGKLREHADHGKVYANRPSLTKEVASLQRQVQETEKAISVIEQEEKEWTSKSSELNSIEVDLKRSEVCRTNLSEQLKDVQISGAEDEGTVEQHEVSADEDALRLKNELKSACDRIERIGRTLTTLSRSRGEAATKISGVQQQIAAEARKRRAPRVAIFDQDADRDWRELGVQRDALDANEQQLNAQWNAMFKLLAGELDLLRRSVAEIKKRASRINGDLKRYRVRNLERVELFVDHDTGAYTTIERMTSSDSMFLNDRDVEDAKRELRQWIVDGKTIELRELFAIRIRIQNQGESRPIEVASLDVIGSEGTGMTAKVMIYLQLLRSIIDDENGEYQMHFYLDEIGRLDDRNLRATTEMAFRRGFTPITAEPEPRAEALAHPEVRIYHLGRDGKSCEIVQELTYVARAKRPVEKAPQ
jgi:hypothetical protein